MKWLALIALAVASPATAQIVSPLSPASGADVSNAQATANSAASAAAAAQATANAAQALIAPVCPTAPSGDTLNGSVGSGTPCTPKADNTRPTAVQAGNTTLAANCTFAATFARAFTSSTPFVYAAVVDSSGNQMPCKIQTRSSTSITGTCNAQQNTVLTLSVVTSGLTVLPFGTTCTAGTPVMFVGREPTQ